MAPPVHIAVFDPLTQLEPELNMTCGHERAQCNAEIDTENRRRSGGPSRLRCHRRQCEIVAVIQYYRSAHTHTLRILPIVVAFIVLQDCDGVVGCVFVCDDQKRV